MGFIDNGMQGGIIPQTNVSHETSGSEIDLTDADIIPDDEGGVTINLDESDADDLPLPADMPWDANLAEYIEEGELGVIGENIIRMFKDDYESNREWRETFNNGLKFLGFKPEDRDWVFKGASGAWDTKLSEAWIRFHAEIFSELFPADGPMRTKIVGEETEELRAQADRVADYANYYLTRVAREYYDDSDIMLNYALLAGSAFRKAYICPILQRPVLKYIAPTQVAIPYSATGIYDAQRFTHICDDLSARDLKILQLNGYYLDVDVTRNKISEDDKNEIDALIGLDDTESADERPYTVYEMMVYYNLPRFEHTDENGEETGLPLPYKITVCEDGTVLRIERNYEQNDQLFQRKLNVAHYKFLPGFGALGIGLIHVMNSSSDTRTKIKRMLQDSGVFSNFPPTVRVKGMRLEQNTAAIAPGANIEIDTGGLAIQNAIQQMPVKEPSQMLYQLSQDEGQSADRLIGNMDISVGDGRQDAPVGTTIALLAAAKKPQTGVMRRLHRALTHELEMLYELMGEWLPDMPYPYPVSGGDGVIMRSDFSQKFNPVPVSDPNVMSQTERMMRTETVMRISSQITPQSPSWQVEAARRMFMQLGVDNIQNLLPPPPQQAQPLDPVSENMDAANGKPLKAFIQQNHDAHIAVHTPMAQNNPALQAHITEHQAMKYKLTIENQLGFPLPPEGTVVDPQIQEKIAMLAAAATQDYMDKLKAQQPPAPPSMEEVMIMDIQQKREKEQLRYKEKMADLETDKEIAEIKSDDAAAERAKDMDVARLKTMAGLVQNKDKTFHNQPSRSQLTGNQPSAAPVVQPSTTFLEQLIKAQPPQNTPSISAGDINKIVSALNSLTTAISQPKQAIYDEDGKIIGMK